MTEIKQLKSNKFIKQRNYKYIRYIILLDKSFLIAGVSKIN